MNGFSLTQQYASLPERFYAPVDLSPVAAPQLLRLNVPLAEALGLDAAWLTSPAGVAMLSGQSMPEGVQPVALAYAGHQFGHFVPRLGDGRALLLGDVTDAAGKTWEIQLKGSGRTSFSRRGDGKAALGPVLREYVLSEAMAALGVPTTRSLAAVRTGEMVLRETPLPGAVMTRVAASHIRVGTFQFFAAREDVAGLRLLADYAIKRHYPDAAQTENPYLTLLEKVIAAQAHLIAQWMLIGFIHGVMNTDNMAVSGETIDYGPCAFMEQYDTGTVFSFIDEHGRYAYGNQPSMALWNLTRLAEALLPLLAEDDEAAITLAQTALAQFEPQFQAAYLQGLRAKMGLITVQERDIALARTLLETMASAQLDFTQTFRAISQPDLHQALTENADALLLPESVVPLAEWLPQWQARLAQEPEITPNARATAMMQTNPCYIPRNHLVEEMIVQAVTENDYSAFENLLAVLANPYTEQPGRERYALPATAAERVRHTFCGT
ncbi:protein adenylyltransferase SelO [Acetobacter indonesiensis]|uniref:protein adenylyltransferase SelO n=1 Tax=Acetobacter indonesiensis TaxID=104101 RepID=UPI0039E806BB